MNPAPLLCLLGPTAVGKTALALALAARWPCRLISVDSAQVYRGLDIGTAKPDAATLARFPHALIDLLPPEESYSAARFVADARAELAAARAAGQIPLLVGGSMLYFHALFGALDDLPPSRPEIRNRLLARPGLTLAHPSLQSAGYQQLGRALLQDGNRAEAEEQALIATRQLAKRQITWMNNRLKTVLPLEIHRPDPPGLINRVAAFLAGAP